MTIPPVTQGHAWHVRFQRVTFLGTVVPVLGTVLLLASTPASAWMYCWNSPATGIENCWGYAPRWYPDGHGPRTEVWLNGELIDDTAWTGEKRQAGIERYRAIMSADGRAYAARQAGAVEEKRAETKKKVDDLTQRILTRMRQSQQTTSAKGDQSP